jgi:hypothetical protein
VINAKNGGTVEEDKGLEAAQRQHSTITELLNGLDIKSLEDTKEASVKKVVAL